MKIVIFNIKDILLDDPGKYSYSWEFGSSILGVLIAQKKPWDQNLP